MKGSEKKALFKSILDTGLSFAKGVIAPINPMAGAVLGAAEGIKNKVAEEKEKNLSSEVGGVGKIDPARLAGTLVFIALAVAFMFGLLSMEDVKELMKVFLKSQ